MNYYYLDASAWVKRYAEESGSEWVRTLFTQEQRLACASLGFIEAMATLARKHKANQLTAADFEEQTQNLIDEWDDFLQFHLTPEALLFARESAYRLALRSAEAIHIGAALLLRQRFAVDPDQVVFVTSSRAMKAAAQWHQLTVLDPTEQETPLPPTKEDKP